MLYIHITIIISAFRSVLFRKLYIYLQLKSNKSNEIRNDNSCKVPISCTMFMFFKPKVQQQNETLRSETLFEQEIKLNSVSSNTRFRNSAIQLNFQSRSILEYQAETRDKVIQNLKEINMSAIQSANTKRIVLTFQRNHKENFKVHVT